MEVGARVADRFVVEAEAGRGGMGVVYRALDEASGERVALKLLSGDAAVDVARFTREGEVLAALHHPNVVRYVAHGHTRDGHVYLAMEWLEGATLSASAGVSSEPRDAVLAGPRVEEASVASSTGPRLGIDDAVHAIALAAAGLGAAHRHGVVHRDVKPANLFLVEGDPRRVKVLDFGIARGLGAGHTLTEAGTIVGTPYFMAPEQARADALVDARVDVYALGAVLYQLLTGRPPLYAEGLMALLAAILLEDPVDVRVRRPGVPEPLAALVMRLLAKDPSARPADGDALAAQLRALGPSPAQGPRSIAPPALTEREQRVLCLVLVKGRFGSGASDVTLAPGQSDLSGPLRAAVEAHGGRADVLADGSMVARVDDAGAPADQAVRAARCARAMRAIAPHLPIAAVAGRGHFHGPIPVGEVIERGSALLTRSPAALDSPGSPPEPSAGRLERGGVLLTRAPAALDSPAAPPEPSAGRLERGGALLTRSRAALGSPAARPGRSAGRDDRPPPLDASSDGAPSEPPLPIRVDEVMVALLSGRFTVTRDPGGAAVLGPEVTASTGEHVRATPRTAFVGRRRELALLEGVIEDAIDEPMARAVVITAAAGMGKTRLLAELLRAVAIPEVWIARGDPLAAGSPFGLLGQLVRSAARIEEGEPLPARRDKLLCTLARAFRDPPTLEAHAARLGDAARIPFAPGASLAVDDPKLRGDATREAWLAWIGATLEAGPLLLVLDDLQWGDTPSVAFVDAALRAHARRPLIVIALGRPELPHRLGEPFRDRDPTSVRLGRLRDSVAERLAREGLGARASDAVIARLVERADGNPFFLEELVRATAEGEGDLGLPTTVLGMVEARLAVLDTATRRVLRAASVFGRRFWRGGVIELLGGAARAGDVDAHLDVLARRELIDRVEPSRFAGEAELAFRHALTREAALAMLTDDDRALGHRLAGAWLEAAGEDDPRALAEHFERGGAMDRAAVWLGRAAAHALEGDDLEDAIETGARALAFSADDDARGPIHLVLADAHRWRGAYPSAREHAIRAAERLPQGGRPWLRAAGIALAAAGRLGDAEEVEAWRRRVLAVDVEPSAIGAKVVALCRAASFALGRGDRERVEATLAACEALADEAPEDPLARAWVLTLRASAALTDGDHGAFVEGTAAAVRAYEAAGDPRDACNQKVRLGNGYVGLGELERAEPVLRDALASAQRMGIRLVEGYALQNLGHALLASGQLDEARAIEERAIELARALGDAVLEAGCLLYAAEARELAADPRGAVRDASRAVSLLADVPAFRVVAEAVLARARLACGETDEALALAERAARALTEHAVEEGEALVRIVHVDALRAAGRDDEAARAHAEARARLEARAARITDERWRDAFLRRVPVHARTMRAS